MRGGGGGGGVGGGAGGALGGAVGGGLGVVVSASSQVGEPTWEEEGLGGWGGLRGRMGETEEGGGQAHPNKQACPFPLHPRGLAHHPT